MIYPWQDNLWKNLQARFAERVPHALLIHGPEGIGKLALAEHLAHSLLCEAADRAQAPCGKCDGCRWFRAGSHPDYRRVEPEALALAQPSAVEAEEPREPPSRAAKPSTEIKVDQIRALDGFLSVVSHRAGRRVSLVHPVEAMNPNAANALLKALEEPQGQAHFVLVSHRPARLLATVKSRCVAIPVGLPERPVAEHWLGAQGVADPDRWLAYAGGAPLRAQAYALESGQALGTLLKAIEARNLDALSAVNDREQLEALAEALQRHALDMAFATLAGRARFGKAATTRDAQAWLRFARQMGRNRALARHPLNPRLFAGEMLREMPKD
jgi:DNA polymerase III subunit delta'